MERRTDTKIGKTKCHAIEPSFWKKPPIVLWTRESFDAIIEIVRMENDGTDEKNTYGCRFVGLSPAEQFKIDVYQIVSETSFN